MAIALAENGADILTYPSAFFFGTGALHWEIILRSRAIETQSYVVAAAQTGKHNSSRVSWGHSMVRLISMKRVKHIIFNTILGS